VPAFAVVSRPSHNDVFFQRRIEVTAPAFDDTSGPHEVVHLGEVATATEIPEIAEVTDIVRIAEVAQSIQSSQFPEAVPAPEPVSIPEPTPTAVVEEPPAVTVESAQPVVEQEPIAPVEPVSVEVPIVAAEPAPPTREELVAVISGGPQPLVRTELQAQPESEKNRGGFFKRLFGRFGK
jgi:hypothetical protein